MLDRGIAMIVSKPLQTLLAGILFLAGAACADQAAAQAWTQLSPTGGPPAGRYIQSAAYNTTDNTMIVFGGIDGFNGCYLSQCLNDVWVLSNADGSSGTPAWTQLSPTGGPPSARAYQASAYDEANNRLIIFAGDPNVGFCGGTVNDTWVLANADGTGGTPTWTQLSPTGGPPAKGQGSSAVYDPTTNSLIVFGGNTNACGSLTNDVWVLSNANGLGGAPVWTQLSPTGTIPARELHSAVYNPTSNRMVVFAGLGNPNVTNDVWVLANANGIGTPAWTQLTPTGTLPDARYFFASVYDAATNSMVVFGGSATPGFVNDVWTLSHADGTGGTPAWTQLSPSGTAPSARDAHTAVYNAANNRMIVFGGTSNCSPTCVVANNDTWVLRGANGIIVPVNIDIRPNTAVNTISKTNGTNIPVAILSSATFNAPTQVDKTSLTFGHSGSEASLIGCDLRASDVNVDGYKDLVCHFNGTLGGFQMGDTTGYLKGFTSAGNSISGSDAVVITK